MLMILARQFVFHVAHCFLLGIWYRAGKFRFLTEGLPLVEVNLWAQVDLGPRLLLSYLPRLPKD